MLMTKLAVTMTAGMVFGLLESWAGAALAVAFLATMITLRQMRREVRELRAEVEGCAVG
jgi:hypothetical protein